MKRIELLFLQLVFIVSSLALAWVFYVEYILQILPCKICLYQRIPHYFVLFLLLVSYIFERARTFAIYLICFAYLVALGLALAQLGLEEKWFQFETSCSSGLSAINSFEEYRHKILNDDEIKCDYVAYRILGFSLSFWNMILSTSLLIMGLMIMLPRFFKRGENA